MFGQEIIHLNVMRQLVKRGEEVHCLVNGWNDGEFPALLAESGIPFTTAFIGKITIRPQRIGWMMDTLRHLRGARREVREMLEELRPDVIVASSRDSVFLLRSVIAPYPVAYHIQEVPRVGLKARLLTRGLDRSVTGFVATSEFVKNRFCELGVAERRIAVASAGIDLPQADLDGSGPPADAERSTPTIGICGQIGEWKGHDVLVNALGALSRSNHDFKLLIYGTGADSYVSVLRQLVTKHGLDERVEWRGFERDRDAMYRNCDIVVVPSRFDDPFPTTVLEAGAYGLPVVGTRRGGIPEQIEDAVTGYLVADGAPDELASRLEALLASRELRERLGENARRRVTDHHQSHHMVDRFIESVNTVCSLRLSPEVEAEA